MGNEGSEIVLQIEWSEMIENLSRLASLRALQLQRDVQRGDLAARLTNVLEVIIYIRSDQIRHQIGSPGGEMQWY